MAELMGSQEKNFFAGLVDFGFRQQQVRRLVKVLYVIAVLGGFVVVWLKADVAWNFVAVALGMVAFGLFALPPLINRAGYE